MPCPSPLCPAGPSTSPPGDTINTPNNSGNAGPSIPVKVGEPLSTACERATVVGAIPMVIRFPGFTTVNGDAIAGVSSNGGICNLGAFFLNRDGCYDDKNAQLASTCA